MKQYKNECVRHEDIYSGKYKVQLKLSSLTETWS